MLAWLTLDIMLAWLALDIILDIIPDWLALDIRLAWVIMLDIKATCPGISFLVGRPHIIVVARPPIGRLYACFILLQLLVGLGFLEHLNLPLDHLLLLLFLPGPLSLLPGVLSHGHPA